jgi:pyridoxal phosphate enzyme (YggS family)
MESLSERIQAVRSRIARAAESVGRSAEDITLVAVTKTLSVDRVREALDLGITHLGENRVQEADDKISALKSYHATWHLVGHLQSNKVNRALHLFDLIHSVDSTRLASAIQARAERDGITAVPCLVQVNISGETTKSGISLESAVEDIISIARNDRVKIQGLMTIAPYTSDPESVRPVFRQLKQLALRVSELGIDGVDMGTLSMGMSGDFEVAIQEGATMVRIGSALFGPRE